MKTFNVRTKTVKATYNYETIEAENLEDARYIAEQKFEEDDYCDEDVYEYTEVIHIKEEEDNDDDES